jgi:4-hydroxy-tetrahydrodipicolinate reductase
VTSSSGAPQDSSGSVGSGAGTDSPLQIGLIGANGRMGGCVRAALSERSDLVLGASFDHGDSLDSARVDVFVEFTNSAAMAELAGKLPRFGKPWVSGTTGLDELAHRRLREASAHIPVLWSPNMSLGVAVLSRLLSEAARLLPPGWEMELFETHHSGKRDAPSGTALALARRWTEIRGGKLRHGREGLAGPRPEGEVGMHALPAAWLAQRKAGLYTMDDWAESRLGERGGNR